MMNHIALRVFLLLTIILYVACKVGSLNECEKRAHTSLNLQQKQELCRNYDIDFSVGPAVCSVAAKDKLHLQYKDIFRLCSGADSAGPVDCLLSIPMTQRNNIGYQLCSNAVSALPAQCYEELTSTKFPHSSNPSKGKSGASMQESVIQFCQHLANPAPLYCIHSALLHTKLPVAQAMNLCKDAVGSISGSSLASNALSTHNFEDEDPLNTLSASCIQSMSQFIQPSLGMTPELVVKFCVAIDPYHHTAAGLTASDAINFQKYALHCFETLSERLQSDKAIQSSISLLGKDRLEICTNPPNSLGPVNCTIELLTKLKRKEPHLKISAVDLKTLCQKASSGQPSNCFIESGGLGNTSFRAQLCHTAENAGPAHCYRKIQSVFRTDVENRLLLCIGASSEGPAACASDAPHYLANDEKVHLCSNAPVDRSRDPIQCLQACQSVTQQFYKAPKKVLGYFQENLQTDAEWTSRGFLISMCSFSDSQHPLASAECLKSSPRSLFHDDAVQMCTNISSVEVIEHIQLCQRLIPKSWPSNATSVLCELSESKSQVEAVVRCAVDSSRLTNLRLSSMDIAHVCSTERARSDDVLTCLKTVAQGLRSIAAATSSTSYKLTSEAIVDICRSDDVTSISTSQSQSRGQCFIEVLQTLLSSHSTIHNEVPHHICKPSSTALQGGGGGSGGNYRFLLKCLQSLHRKLITVHDVLTCSEERRVVKDIRVRQLWNEEDGGKDVIAGRRFTIIFELYDQYQQLYITTTSSTHSEEQPLFKISINENNAQGAILWGNRLNTSHSSTGFLTYHHLVVSQPGRVEVRISQVNPTFFSDSHRDRLAVSGSPANTVEVINSFHITIQEDPRMVGSRPCLYVFSHNICPVESVSEDYESLFPMTRHYLPSSYYLANIHCSNESLAVMRVTSHLVSDGSMWIEYKLGLDSIWTGVGLPTVEMPPLQRLQVSLPAALLPAATTSQRRGKAVVDEGEKEEMTKESRKKVLKLIKRGYYRASLQWHPDRWMAYDQYYQAAISAIFPLITEAYERLMQQYGGSSGTGNSGRESNTEESSEVYA